jgi:hypothetical protein
MAGRRGGRIKLTKTQIDKIVEMVGVGHFRTYAITSVGIAMSTYSIWKKRYEDIMTGKEPVRVPKSEKEKLVNFFTRLKEAETKNYDFHVRNIKDAAAKNPKWSAYWLERFDRENWQEKKAVDITAAVSHSFSMKATMEAWQKKQK